MTKVKVKIGSFIKLSDMEDAKYNGKKGVVVSEMEKKEIEVKIRGHSDLVTVKKSHAEVVEPSPLPDPKDTKRGTVQPSDHVSHALVKALLELLVRDKDGYHPSVIEFTGPAAQEFGKLGSAACFSYFSAVQKEQLGAMCALTHMCQQGDGMKEQVMFGLLSSDKMCLECIMMMIYQTPHVIPGKSRKGAAGKNSDPLSVTTHSTASTAKSRRAKFADSQNLSKRSFEDLGDAMKPSQMLREQESEEYIKAMRRGPMGLIDEFFKYKYGIALFAAIYRNKYWYVFAHKLIRIICREARWKEDGMKLGGFCRRILVGIANGAESLGEPFLDELVLQKLSRGPIPGGCAEEILLEESRVKTASGIRENLNEMLKG